MENYDTSLNNSSINSKFSYLNKQPSLLEEAIKKTFEIYCKIIFTFYCRLEINGRNNVPDSSFIFCSNHCSHMDSAVLMISSGVPFKRFGMMAAADYFFENKRRKTFLNMLMNLIPIERKASHKAISETIDVCKEFTKSGKRSIIIYPEGTRSLSGEIQKFKRGPAMIAYQLGLPIIPVYIDGTYRSWPKGNVLMKPVKITANIGEPIYPERISDNLRDSGNMRSIYNNITNELWNRIIQLKEKHFNAR